MAFGFPGFFATFAICFGMMWVFFAQGLMAFFSALAQAFVLLAWAWWLFWACLFAVIGYVLIWLGVLGGLLGIGGVITLFVLYQKDIFLAR